MWMNLFIGRVDEPWMRHVDYPDSSVSPPQLRNGNVHYVSDAGVRGKVERTVGEAALADGLWHTLRLLRNATATVLLVDGGRPRVIQHATQDFGGLAVVTFSLGGIPPGPAQQKTSAGERRIFCVVWIPPMWSGSRFGFNHAGQV